MRSSFFLIYRILRLDSDAVLKPATLALILFMMAVNALWKLGFLPRPESIR